jgi:hypothetical protein
MLRFHTAASPGHSKLTSLAHPTPNVIARLERATQYSSDLRLSR